MSAFLARLCHLFSLSYCSSVESRATHCILLRVQTLYAVRASGHVPGMRQCHGSIAVDKRAIELVSSTMDSGLLCAYDAACILVVE
ncbi:hypothetical protein BDY17DRAFT_77046 [Neohortaea acidophila]|uniref:Secreted protein n=1 Tax=Neohortaea acidophila TaxID=245834 RepID=A0A6A6Q3Y9_9PEZI|nr:uncharacterized protein BDY17DRAFT_77046 [Neohortaea acidophila]KAF2486373.1 hypothetical protein BDY17DRAFT_77046 [Neohortaea acidophila]